MDIREKLGLLPNTEVEFEIDRDAVRIRKARGRHARGGRGRALIEHMRGRATSGLTTDENHAADAGLTSVPATLADSNGLLDVLTEDEEWFEWSAERLSVAAGSIGRPSPISTSERTQP